MNAGLIDAFEIKFRSALRNLNFAILIGAMLLALCFPVQAQQLFLSAFLRLLEGHDENGARHCQ
jgi:hypothetical protein